VIDAGGLAPRERCIAIPVPLLQGLPINDPNTPRARERDHFALLELRQRAAHRFDGQRQTIGDVVARDRQHDGVRRTAGEAFNQFEQEGANLLPRRDAAEDQEMSARSRERLVRDLTEFARQLRVCVRHHLGALARVTRAYRALDDRLDGGIVFVALRETEKIAREQQIDDLAPAVGPYDAAPG